MLKRTERIAFRMSSVFSKVEPEPGAAPAHRRRLHGPPEANGVHQVVDGCLVVAFVVFAASRLDYVIFVYPWR